MSWRGLAAALLLPVSCGGRELALPPAEPYPPNDVTELARIFDPRLESLGLRLVRGRLIDRSQGGYRPSDTGTHLALYVEPIDASTTDRYISNIVPLTRVFTPEVFERWPRLASFDVCQEPSVHDDPEPPPVSQVTVFRGPATSLDWEAIDLAGLIRATRQYPDEVDVVLSPLLQRSPRIGPLLPGGA